MTVKTGTSTLPQDANGHDIQAPSKFQAQDATATPNKAPLTVAGTEIVLVTPTDAVTVVFSPVGADLRVATTVNGTAAAPYLVIKDGTTKPLPVANMANLYVLRDAAVSVTLHFHYEMVG